MFQLSYGDTLLPLCEDWVISHLHSLMTSCLHDFILERLSLRISLSKYRMESYLVKLEYSVSPINITEVLFRKLSGQDRVIEGWRQTKKHIVFVWAFFFLIEFVFWWVFNKKKKKYWSWNCVVLHFIAIPHIRIECDKNITFNSNPSVFKYI